MTPKRRTKPGRGWLVRSRDKPCIRCRTATYFVEKQADFTRNEVDLSVLKQ